MARARDRRPARASGPGAPTRLAVGAPAAPPLAGMPARIAPWLLATLGFAIAFGLCVVKWRFYLYKDFDLAIFSEAMVRLGQGSLHSTIRGMPWLGDHASYVMFLLAPLYALAPHPLTLLLVQSAAVTLVAADPRLSRPEHAALRTLLLERFREPLELALAG